MVLDGHWHSRDEQQAYKETIAHSLAVAQAAGLDGLIEMPNVKDPVTTIKRCHERVALARKANSPVKFYLHAGATDDPEQLREIIQATKEIPEVVGIKLFAGRSTGSLSVVEYDKQLIVFDTLAQENYDGVVVVHCEKEFEMSDDSYDPKNPITWSTLARPESAEVASFLDILEICEDVEFRGTFHVAHVSTCTVVDEVYSYKGPVTLSCGVTLHHALLDNSYLERSDGQWYKCNPPLRSKKTQEGLLQRLLDGRIPILESDHAPHTEEEKSGDRPASGIACGTGWPYIMQHLRDLGMSEERLEDVTHNNAVEMYGLDLEAQHRPVDWAKLKELQGDYGHDPFKGVF